MATLLASRIQCRRSEGNGFRLLKDMVPGLGRAAMLVYPEAQQSDRAFFLNPFERSRPFLRGEASSKAKSQAFKRSNPSSQAWQHPEHGRSRRCHALTPHSPTSAGRSSRSRRVLDVPASYPYRYYVGQGGLMSYGVNNIDLFRQAAPYVDSLSARRKARRFAGSATHPV